MSTNIHPSLDGIGERIRTIRRRLGMTQSALAGDDITRNMISRIENGAVLPSLTSLCAIAARLDVPIGALFDDFEDYDVQRLATSLKKLILAGRYARAIDTFLSSELDKIPDEISVMMAEAYYGRARELYSLGRLCEAKRMLADADRFAVSCADIRLSEQIFLLSSLIDACTAVGEGDIHSDTVNEGDRLKDIIFNKNELAIYLYAAKKLGNIAAMPYSQPHESAAPLRAELSPLIEALPEGLYRSHIEAKLDMLSADYLSAKAKLLTLTDANTAPSMLYVLYTDLEFCCKCCGDFENAYKYSNLRIELLKKIT